MGKAFNITLKYVIPLLLITIAGGFALLHTQGDQLLSVQTGSMEPVISAGDLLVVESVPIHELQVGDVITFKSDQETYAGSTITHRIVELPSDENARNFITKGDSNPTIDEPVPSNQIVGRVNKDVPLVGHLLSFLSTPIGLLALIYIPALFIIIDEIKRLAKHFDAQKPWRDLGHSRILTHVVTSVAIIGLVGGSGVTLASINNSVLITGNTISATNDGGGGGNGCEENGSNVVINGGGGGGNSNINININTNQNATSGNATNSGNTNGGNATSGDASNCNSVDIDISI